MVWASPFPPTGLMCSREVDVIEEILRVYGYNNIVFQEKLNASIAPISNLEDHRLQSIIGSQLASAGFFEILTNSLTSPKYLTEASGIKYKESIGILNPLSEELSVLRQSMLFNGLEAVIFQYQPKKP